jgi:hypothetical protein
MDSYADPKTGQAVKLDHAWTGTLVAPPVEFTVVGSSKPAGPN